LLNEAAVASALGAESVTDLVHLSGGASRETWSCTALAAGAHRRIVVQVQRLGSPNDINVEAGVLRAAATAGVPVAAVVASSDDPAALGAPYLVVEHVDGETIARRILRDDVFASARERLVADCGRALARLHSLDPGSVAGLETTDPLGRYREVLDQSGEPHPAFELGFRWLEANRPPGRRPVVVHGDFRLGNLIVGSDGLRAAIDWELAHAGDPAEDLGWLCVRAWRFGGSQPVAGLGSYAQLLDAYAGAGGEPVDPETLRWWEAFGTLKWGIMCIMQAATHLTGAARSHELAAIGRRVCENEHDLLALLP
jgi:aminoglycoside phosphotransferase (APT) family kinase protein